MATRYSQLNIDIDIDTLKQKTGVTDTHQTIEQEQLWSLSGLLGSYKKFVRSSGFDLNNADVEDLKECASKHGNQQAMYEALKKWGNVIRDFTYQSLLEILISLREGALADQVCRTCELLSYNLCFHHFLCFQSSRHKPVSRIKKTLCPCHLHQVSRSVWS